jgi:hypothetical protein
MRAGNAEIEYWAKIANALFFCFRCNGRRFAFFGKSVSSRSHVCLLAEMPFLVGIPAHPVAVLSNVFIYWGASD